MKLRIPWLTLKTIEIKVIAPEVVSPLTHSIEEVVDTTKPKRSRAKKQPELFPPAKDEISANINLLKDSYEQSKNFPVGITPEEAFPFGGH